MYTINKKTKNTNDFKILFNTRIPKFNDIDTLLYHFCLFKFYTHAHMFYFIVIKCTSFFIFCCMVILAFKYLHK